MEKQTLFTQTTFVNKTVNCIYSESEVEESWTNDIGKFFKDCQKEYGRCISSIYRSINEETKKLGWVFESKIKYKDTNEYYIRETWVELHKALPTKTTKYHYLFLK